MDCEDGKVYDKVSDCPVCNMKLTISEKMTCSLHKDGNCSCEGDKFECTNCPEHS